MKKTLLKLFLALTLIAIAALTYGYIQIQHYLHEPGPAELQTTLLIEPGTSSTAIATQLAETGVIEQPQLFRWLAIVNGQHDTFQAGEYAFEPGISPSQVMEKLSHGDIVIHQVTVPEGFTSARIVELINDTKDLEGLLTNIPREGSLLPESYRYTRGETKQAVLARMEEAMRKTLVELWPNRQDNLPVATPEEAVILASIVEKETGIPAERPDVAAVYINRLRKGMLLQADPTVAYGRYGGQYADKPISRSDLKADTPYNTYLHAGLPPTPICNPGRASLEAVLKPSQSTALYFVADGKGGHIFANTLDEHNRNVAAYRRWQRETGAR
jgi:UPF0755 protein